jgi:hypothetical protein
MNSNETNEAKFPFRYYDHDARELLTRTNTELAVIFDAMVEQNLLDEHVAEALLTLAAYTRFKRSEIAQQALNVFAGLVKNHIHKKKIKQVIDLAFSGRHSSVPDSFREVLIEAVTELSEDNEIYQHLSNKVVKFSHKEQKKPHEIESATEALTIAGQIPPKLAQEYLTRYLELGGSEEEITYINLRVLRIRAMYRALANEYRQNGQDIKDVLRELLLRRFKREKNPGKNTSGRKERGSKESAREFAKVDSFFAVKSQITIPSEYAESVLRTYLEVFQDSLDVDDVKFIHKSAVALKDVPVLTFLQIEYAKLKDKRRNEEEQKIFDFLLPIFSQDVRGVERRSSVPSSLDKIHPDMKGVKYAEGGANRDARSEIDGYLSDNDDK